MNSSATIKHITLPDRPPAGWPKCFMLFAGGILAFGGMTKLFAVAEKSQQFDMSDPITGIQFRDLFIVVGMAELFVALLCLFTNKKSLSLGLVACLAASFAIYRIRLWFMGWHHPYALLGGITETLNISPFLADGVVSLSSAFLLIGSLAILWFRKGDKIALPNNTVAFLKMSCFFCKKHIEFPAHAIGEKISCPHCKMEIILKKPA